MSDNDSRVSVASEMEPGGKTIVRHPTRVSSMLLLVFDLVFLGLVPLATSEAPVWALVFGLVVIVLLLLRGHYRTRMVQDLSKDLSLLAGAVAAAVLGVAIGATLFDFSEPRLATLAASSFGVFVLLAASRTVAFAGLRWFRRHGYLRSRALVIGTGLVAREIGVEFTYRQDYGVDIAGYVASSDLSPEVHLPGAIVGNLDDLADLARITSSDRVIVTLGTRADDGVVDALRTLRMSDCSVFVMPQLFELGMGADSMTPDRARGFALVRLGRSAHPVIGIRMKRLFDIAASGAALLILLPVLLLAAATVRFTSKGPVLFRQERVGRFGVPFELLKFRSMRVNNDGDTSWTPNSSEAMVTRVGRVLRLSSIDELPQLWNIFRGDMSIVGPRPERPVFVERFSATVPGYKHRHRLPMGLTGLAQVKGLRGDTPIEERVKFDNLYIDQWSFFGDIQLIIRTSWAIVRQRAYAEAEIDMSRVLAEVENREQVVLDLVSEERSSR